MTQEGNVKKIPKKRNLKRFDQSTYPVFEVKPFLHFTYLLPKTYDITFSLPRAAVHGDLLKYKNQRSTLPGAILIQPASGLSVQEDPRIILKIVEGKFFSQYPFLDLI